MRVPLPMKHLTGNQALDGLLLDLDSKLLGMPTVRALTVDEIRETLLDRQRVALQTGLNAEEAARRAVAQVGPLDELARSQRNGVIRAFLLRLLFPALGLPFSFALATSAWRLLTHHWPSEEMQNRIGFSMLVAFAWIAVSTFRHVVRFPNRPIPVPTSEDEFRVTAPVWMARNLRLTALILPAVLVFGLVSLIARHFNQGSPMHFLSTLGPVLLPLAVMSPAFALIWLLSVGQASFRVRADGFWRESATGKSWWRWEDLQAIAVERRWFFGSTIRLGKLHCRTANGRQRRFYVSAVMVNGDRLLDLASAKVESRGTQATASPDLLQNGNA